MSNPISFLEDHTFPSGLKINFETSGTDYFRELKACKVQKDLENFIIRWEYLFVEIKDADVKLEDIQLLFESKESQIKFQEKAYEDDCYSKRLLAVFFPETLQKLMNIANFNEVPFGLLLFQFKKHGLVEEVDGYWKIKIS